VKVIVGLGNPGLRFRWTRHNIGFRVVHRLAEANHIAISTERFQSLCGTGSIGSQRVLLLEPMTFMNRSGEAVREAVDFYKLDPGDLVIVHDDLDLPLGRLRFKRRGGDGGHQGVRSIIDSVGKGTFVRLKVGIGRPPEGIDPADYVLSRFDKAEKEEVEKIVSRGAESLRVMLLEGIDTAMNRYQKRIEQGGT
jgi:PTH1 family peptidyl-tRNA hydrolase